MRVKPTIEPRESLSEGRDLMGAYCAQALDTPLLNREEEQVLATKIQKWIGNKRAGQGTRNAGEKAKEQMVLANLRLVVNVSKKFMQTIKAWHLSTSTRAPGRPGARVPGRPAWVGAPVLPTYKLQKTIAQKCNPHTHTLT